MHERFEVTFASQLMNLKLEPESVNSCLRIHRPLRSARYVLQHASKSESALDAWKSGHLELGECS